MGKYDGMGLGEYLRAKEADDKAAAEAASRARIATLESGIQTQPTESSVDDNGIYTPAYNPHFVDPEGHSGSDKYAQKTRADIYRAQWNDYKERFSPLEDMLINNVTSGERLDTALAKGGTALNQQFNLADGTFQRNNSRYGIGLTPTQQSQHETRLGLTKAATEANMRNSTRRSVADRNMSLMTGMSGTKEEMV